MCLTPLPSSDCLLSVGQSYPHQSVFRFRSTSVSGFPLLWLTIRIPCSVSGNGKGLTSSCHFSLHMPRHSTPTVPPKSHPNDFFVLASVANKTSPTAFIALTMLVHGFRDVQAPCGLWSSLCTLRKSSIVHACRSLSRLQRSAGCATLDRGGWLDLTNAFYGILPIGTFTR